MSASVDRPAQHPRASSRARASRVQAALTALAFILASLFGILHEAATAHVRCAEHGELIHRDATVASTDGSAHTQLRGELRAEAVPGHEHCSLVSATRESRLVPRPPAILSGPVTSAAPVATPPRAVPAHAGSLYRTAPKTSPPA